MVAAAGGNVVSWTASHANTMATTAELCALSSARGRGTAWGRVAQFGPSVRADLTYGIVGFPRQTNLGAGIKSSASRMIQS